MHGMECVVAQIVAFFYLYVLVSALLKFDVSNVSKLEQYQSVSLDLPNSVSRLLSFYGLGTCVAVMKHCLG